MPEDVKPWDVVYNQINPQRQPDSVLVLSTEGELDALEAQLGSPLPLSYRAFLSRFGPGELEALIRLTPIACSHRPDWTVAEETRSQRDFFGRPRFANAAWLARVVYFGCNAGGEWYVWDPVELGASTNREAPIYCLYRHNEDQPELFASSFYEAIQVALARARELREEYEEPEDEEDRTPENAYTPYFSREKQRPDERDTNLWLASNNHTARDLALSIRDAGHTEAFPILADALQEAGCTNADLLDSCRTGDPDIDGKWVLQVLLGNAK